MIPSLLQIPSAVSDSKLHSVLPNDGKGDFTFDRSTGATRINRDGLIEEVGYFSSQLVQNGNFSELGSDVVLNGNFDNGSTNWTLIGDVSIGNGVCTFFDTGSNTNSRLVQVGITANKTYKVVFSVTRYVAGRVQLIFGGASAVNVNISAGVGTYTAYVTAGGSTQWEIKRDGGVPNFDFDVDNVSVKQVDPNDRWFSLGTGWSFGDGVVSSDGSQSANSDCTQNITTDAGKTYKITYTISEYSAGGVFIRLASGNVTTTQTSAGTFSENLSAIGGTQIRIRANSTFVGTISNISVVEVQGDRPRLSYDITNGVVEDKPHLLLETSSTNLFEYDIDFSQSAWTKSNVTLQSNIAISPEGIQNASNIYPTNNIAYIYNTTTASSSVYTVSAYVKANGKNVAWLYSNSSSTNGTIYFDLSDESMQVVAGGVGTPTGTISKMPNGWYRLTYTTGTAVSLTGGSGVGVSDAKGSFNATQNGTDGILVYGLQLEAGSYATSLIPTAGTTITRAAETCNNSKPSVNSTEGVLYAEIAALADDFVDKRISISDGTLNNFVTVGFSRFAGNIIGEIFSGGVLQTSNFGATGVNKLNNNKFAMVWNSTNTKFYLNGSVTNDESISAPTGLNIVQFSAGDLTLPMFAKIKGLAVYNEALSESQLMQLTGVTASSIYSNFVTRTASFTVEALNEVKKVIDNL